jgi:two-component system OmpR family response regulator
LIVGRNRLSRNEGTRAYFDKLPTMRILFIPCSHPRSLWLFDALVESGHSLLRAEDLADGILLAPEESFDAIIATAFDPQTHAELIACLGKLAFGSGGAAILLILYETTADERVQLFQAGADACFTLPLSFLELHERLCAINRSRQVGKSPVQSVQYELILDSISNILIAADERISVTRRERLVLECLIRHVNFPVPRNELIRYAWSDAESVDTSTVNLAINRLRRKICRRLPWLSIETIKRFGYQLTINMEQEAGETLRRVDDC